METNNLIPVLVREIAPQTPTINTYELVREDGADLPEICAGSHIDVHLPNGMVRSYSICSSHDERSHYVIAVRKDISSAGGSKYLHDCIRPGDRLSISEPRNNFPLEEAAAQSLLIAGGIGITPILSMIRRLTDIKRPWEMYYCSRSRDDVAFLPECEALAKAAGANFHLHIDDEQSGSYLDMASVIAKIKPHTHVYCCGPLPMLESFERAASSLPQHTVHREYFSAKEEASLEGGYTVTLAKSEKVLYVPEGKSILKTLLEAGIHVPHACQEGTCGSCETGVVSGIPDHRDSVLSAEEQASNETMMVCCSGCKGEELVLDL